MLQWIKKSYVFHNNRALSSRFTKGNVMKSGIGVMLFLTTCLFAQMQDLPAISGADSLYMTRTGYDYNGDKGTEIIVYLVHRSTKKHYVGVYSFLDSNYIYSSLSSDKMEPVISGDFSGDDQIDFAVHKKIVVFPTNSGIVNKQEIFKQVQTQIHPNPFAKSAHIKFMLSKDSKVSVSIYNLHGKLIKNLFSGKLKQGMHSLTWNIDKQKNSSVANSKYIVEVATNNYSSYEMITCVR